MSTRMLVRDRKERDAIHRICRQLSQSDKPCNFAGIWIPSFKDGVSCAPIEIYSPQPMNVPSALVFYEDFKYGI